MNRTSHHKHLNSKSLHKSGLSPDIIADSVKYTHQILDQIDDKLLEVGVGRLSDMVELANLSAIVGNLFGAGVAKNSSGVFQRNGPHKYPDLLSQIAEAKDIEIKVALETNKPKSHLAKEGPHMICRYVLVQEDLSLLMNNRGKRVAIWEVRFGHLLSQHYNVSNTEGDSGKTAVVNAMGMEELVPVYVDLSICPYSPNSRVYRQYVDSLSNT